MHYCNDKWPFCQLVINNIIILTLGCPVTIPYAATIRNVCYLLKTLKIFGECEIYLYKVYTRTITYKKNKSIIALDCVVRMLGPHRRTIYFNELSYCIVHVCMYVRGCVVYICKPYRTGLREKKSLNSDQVLNYNVGGFPIDSNQVCVQAYILCIYMYFCIYTYVWKCGRVQSHGYLSEFLV